MHLESVERAAPSCPAIQRAGHLVRIAAVAVVLVCVGLVGHRAPAQAQQNAPCSGGGRTAWASSPRPGIDYDARLAIISFTDHCGQPVPLGVDIAADEARRELGLMDIGDLPRDQGELFDMSDVAGGVEVRVSFYMKDTLIPLSIAFIGKDGIVQEIQDMEPETLTLHTPADPYLYAVEVNQGWFDRHGVVAGSHVDLSAAIAIAEPWMAP